MTRLAVIDHEPPQAGHHGGAERMLAMLRLLREDNHDVTFASLRPWPDDLIFSAQRLERLGIRCAALDGSVVDWLQTAGTDFDAVIASRLLVAETILPAIRSIGLGTRFIYDAQHVEHLWKFRLAKQTRNRPLLAAALRDRTVEREVVTAADAVIAASQEDADELRRLGPGTGVHVVTAVHSAADSSDRAVGPRTGMVFLGFLGMAENESAVWRLIDGVWPLVHAELGPIPLTIIGAAPPDWLLEVSTERPGLTVTGFANDVDRRLRQAGVLVVPVNGGSGVKSKVLHAFSRRLPVVATADGVRGVPAVDGVHFLHAETNAELAAATVRILRCPDLGSRLADHAARLLQARFNDEVSRAGLRAALGSHA